MSPLSNGSSQKNLNSGPGVIRVSGARAHNLKNLDVEIPREKITVITGLSGSGKSSLAFDTVYAEGQRRYVESLSSYARQFLDQLSRPDIDSISGLSPTISIEQKTTGYNPRSTVGTITEIHDFLRVLYARISRPSCYKCGEPIRSQSQQQIVDQILEQKENTRLAILAPIVRGRKGEYLKELATLRQRGFVRVRIDKKIYDLGDDIRLEKNLKHDIDVFVDRLVVKGDRSVLATRVSESSDLALKLGSGYLVIETYTGKSTVNRQLLSQKFACTKCGISYPEPEPRSFSYNSPMGACRECDGLGEDEDENVCEDCSGARLRKESLSFYIHGKNIHDISSMSIQEGIDFLESLPLDARERKIGERIIREIVKRFEFLERVGLGYLNLARPALTLSGGEAQRTRLASQIGSSLVDVIYILDEPSIGLHPKDHENLLDILKDLRDMGNTVLVVEHDRETMEHADWLVDLGPGAGVHGGELVAAGSYSNLLKNKKSLTGLYLSGKTEIETPKVRREWSKNRCVGVKGATANNLKSVDLQIPLGTLTCVTGVSGSGKSSLIIDTLYPAIYEQLYDWDAEELQMKSLHGIEHVDKIIDIDQSPIGKTPRSNPATYVGLFSMIRDLFASLPESKVRGYQPGQFSFNVKGGRCEACEGGGMVRVEMHFLPNVYVECEACGGSRYNQETLEVLYKGKNIAQVLNLTAKEAYEFFDAIPLLKRKLKVINDVGLGYIHLGQNATTLSGGEAQRIKLSKELSRASTGKTVYILDEPSTGLHFEDVKGLLQILNRLVDQGNTVIVIEHNLDIVKTADHVIDLGPEGGIGGGEIVATGTPEEVSKVKGSHTGRYLKNYL